jgi:hypothetical protein
VTIFEQRLTAQLLSGPKPESVEAAVSHLLAVQGQDPRGFRLAMRARTTGTTAADVDAALSDRRTLVVTWLNRGTLHLVTAADYWWLHPLTTPQLVTGNATRLAQEGVSPKQVDRGVAVIHREVADRGPRTRAELRAALDDAKVPTPGEALVHLLFAASLRGDLVRGPIRDKQPCFVSAADWLGPAPKALERTEALQRLADRYLAGHGPASDRDLAKWAGITLGDARIGLASAPEIPFSAAPVPRPMLLGPYDPVLCGWASRDFVVGEHAGVVTNNGLFRSFALVGGRAVATWGFDRGRITIRLLEPVTKAQLRELQEDATDVLRFLGLPQSEAVVAS